MSLLTLVAALATSNTCPSNFTQHTKIGLVDGAHLLSAVPAADYTSWCVRTVLPSHILKCCAPHHERSLTSLPPPCLHSCAACAATPQCAAFTFQPPQKGKSNCRMTDAAHIMPHAASFPSGSAVPLPPPTPTPPPPTPPTPPKFPNFCTTGAGKGKCKNVLYFVADDMRADWHTYGLPTVTPNLDALAAKSLLFEHAYCQLSVCAPSRMSFMTSRRPDTNEVWNFIDTNELNGSATPGHFRDHGYITLGLGKTFHQNAGAWNAKQYWSVDEKPYFPYGVGKCPHGGQGGGHCMQNDDQIYDWHLRNETINYLEYATNESKDTGRPFFVMAGFRKPHAPWQYPKVRLPNRVH